MRSQVHQLLDTRSVACCVCDQSPNDKLKYNLYPLFAEEIEHTTDVDWHKKPITQSPASGSHNGHRRWREQRSPTLETIEYRLKTN